MKPRNRINGIRRYGRTRNKGFSVLFVLSIGLVVLMGVMAVTDALVSAQRNVATQVYMNESTSAAENSLQYAIGLLNAAAAAQTLSSITSPILIPSQITGNAKVTVTMTRVPSAVLYSSTLSTPVWNSTAFPSYTNASNPPVYILLSAQSQYGTFQRTINVILGQTFTQTGNPKTPSTAYFNSANVRQPIRASKRSQRSLRKLVHSNFCVVRSNFSKQQQSSFALRSNNDCGFNQRQLI